MRKIISIVLVMVLLVSVVPLAVMPAGAQQAGIPFAGEDNELTMEELVNDAILPYMLGKGDLKLDDVGDASWVYAYWNIDDVGKPKTITDSANRKVTIYRPVESIVVTFRQALEMVRSIGVEENQVVGVESLVQSSGGPPWGVNYKVFFPEYQDKPTVGLIWEPDCEAILYLQPDVVFLIAESWSGAPIDEAQDVLESAGITVIRVYGGVWGKEILEEVEELGYIFDKQDEAEEFIDWYEGIMNSIEGTVDGIPEEDKPKVYFECNDKWNNADESRALVGSAGGKSIFPNLREEVNPAAIMNESPNIIVKASWGCGGYHLNADDTAKLEEIREEIMNRDELKNVPAVQEGEERVYVICGYILCYGPASGCRGFLQTAYMAKWFHPTLFDELVPQDIHQYYLTKFQGLNNINLDTQGVFVYPEPE